MRYFKYNNFSKIYNRALKEQYKSLTGCEKRTFRKEKRWRRFSNIFSVILYIIFVGSGLCLLKFIQQPDVWYWDFLVDIIKIISAIIIFVVAAILTVIMTKPLWKKVASFDIPRMKKVIFSKACKHLRDYYGIRDSYIITKCFDATDKKFKNHDVCIFFEDDELRITADLIHGFLYEERDLGCYAFKKHEILLSKQQKEKGLIVELKSDNIEFYLGYRAKAYIEKNINL